MFRFFNLLENASPCHIVWKKKSCEILHLYTLRCAARWCWRQDPGNHSCWIHLQHWWFCVTAGEGGQFQAIRHLAAHLHSPQRGGRTAHIPDSQGTDLIYTAAFTHTQTCFSFKLIVCPKLKFRQFSAHHRVDGGFVTKKKADKKI